MDRSLRKRNLRIQRLRLVENGDDFGRLVVELLRLVRSLDIRSLEIVEDDGFVGDLLVQLVERFGELLPIRAMYVSRYLAF